MKLKSLFFLLPVVLAAACAPSAVDDGAADDEGAITGTAVDEVAVDVGNDAAFAQKVRRIEAIPDDGKPHTIDMAYFIYGNDYSSSYLTKRVLEKAQRGTKVRILADASQTSPEKRKFFRMLVARGASNVRVAYFRPTPPEVAEDIRSWGFTDPSATLSALFSFDAARVSALLATNTVLRDNAALGKVFATLVTLLGGTPSGASRDPAPVLALVSELSAAAAPSREDGLAAVQRAFAAAGFTFRLAKWVEMSKLLHYKLLVVDRAYVQGGGRNIEDSYNWELDHPLRTQGRDHYVFMDADFSVENRRIGERAAKTMDRWFECIGAASCDAGVRIDGESAEDSAEVFATMEQRAAAFATHLGYARTAAPIHDRRFVAKGVRATYLENRLFVDPTSTSRLLPEEKSEFHREWIRRADAVPAGKTILLQNAYLFLPQGTQAAIVRAAKRGVVVRLVSNSPSSSDLGFIARLARLQYSALLRLGGDVKVLEYQTQESLHAKVTVLGDDLVVGSVNADPRSELLDTNNALVISRGASGESMADSYRTWLVDLLAGLEKKMLVREITPVLLSAEKAAFLDSFGADAGRRRTAETLLESLGALVDASVELDAGGQPMPTARRAGAVIEALALQL